MKPPHKTPTLITQLDEFAAKLIEEASAAGVGQGAGTEGADGAIAAAGSAEGVEFGNRVQLFTALTRYMLVRHRIEPEEENDGWGREVDKFHRGTPRGKAAARKGAADPPAASRNGSGAGRASPGAAGPTPGAATGGEQGGEG